MASARITSVRTVWVQCSLPPVLPGAG